MNKANKPKIKELSNLLGGRLEPLVRCDGEKQTQEELVERLFFYKKGNSKFLPNPNLRENLKSRGAYWHCQKDSTKLNNVGYKHQYKSFLLRF